MYHPTTPTRPIWPLLLLLLSLVSASPLPGRSSAPGTPTLPLPSHTVFQLSDNGTWFENIAVRSNGALLATLLDTSPSLYQVSEPWLATQQHPSDGELLYTFPGATGLLGIAETEPDVFVIAAGNLTTDVVGIPGSWSLWEVDFSGSQPGFAVRKITDVPGALFLNGLAVIPAGPGNGDTPVVLVSDSTLGLVYRVNPRTGAHSVAVQTPEMAPLVDTPPIIGINGIKYSACDGYLYFDNSYAATVYRVALSPDGSPAATTAIVETVSVVSGAIFLDDFTFGPGSDGDDDDSAIWAATNAGDTIEWIDPTTGTSAVVEGSDTTLTVAGGTAAAFGRSVYDRDILYVVTGGAQVRPVNGTVIEPAKIVAVDTKGFRAAV
ncbi:hypothetical protein BX600DRAFT_307075 [Xylariales sp. PMI_506]|nr:hypothetical protein BX600DRAFT_307075 [Xylariales sp. PMI_506]